MRKLIALMVCIFILSGAIAPLAYAEDGRIDLYEVFSNKVDQAKTEVGSRIYKWSMHLPDDAVIYKSEQVNIFSMSTNSYQAAVALEVNKNKDNQTLEEILYNMQNQSKLGYYWLWGDKEFQVDITSDQWGQRYIRIIKAGGYYDYYLMDKAAEEFREYIENRIYIANNYIYNLTISMNGEFYRQHEEMFSKLASSFRLEFDEKNPFIKELSDSVSVKREFINTSYGWKLVLSPYWKMEGTPNARIQSFRPVYSDEEMYQTEQLLEESATGFKIPEGITVSLIGSSTTSETAEQWALKDIEKMKNNYNDKIFDILSSKTSTQNGMQVYDFEVRFNTVTKKPYIMHNLYAIGNGYKYLVTALMMEDKYLDSAKKGSFENMLKSFKLDKTALSKYLGKITQAETIINFDAPKELKMKKYDFTANVTRNWSLDSLATEMYEEGYYDDYMYNEYGGPYSESVSNNEVLSAFEPQSNIRLNMSAGLNSNNMEEIMSQKAETLLKDDEVRLGLAKVGIWSADYNGAVIYKVSKEYDPEAISSFVEEDATKMYSFDVLKNEYEYIIKVGQDTYVQNVTVPVSNMSSSNLEKIRSIWNNTLVNKVSYSKADIKWKEHRLEEFDKE